MNPPRPTPAEERDRLDRLRELFVLDSAPEPLFDRLARQAAALCGAPIALLSLVDEERQWFKANVGLAGVQQTPRDQAFCAWTITGDAIFEVTDAAADPRFADNPLVTGAPNIRWYAGAPLRLEGGARVGSLCVIDRQPRRLSADQTRALRELAAVASDALAMRRDLIAKTLAARSSYEQELRRAEARYRAIVEDQAEMVSLARADGTLVYVNPAYARHFGRTPQAMIGTSLFDHVEPQDRETVRALLGEIVRTGAVHTSENRMTAADGSQRWVAWTNSVHLDTGLEETRGGAAPAGRSAADASDAPGHGLAGQRLLHSVGRDITERRRAEQQVVDSERFLRQLADSLPLRIAYLDRQRRYRFVNQELLRRFGRDSTEVIGRTRAELLSAADDAAVAERARAVLAGIPQQFEFEERVNGEVRRFENRLVPDRSASGEVRGFFVAGIDTTDRSIAEKALRELAAIFENTTDYVVQTDWAGRLLYLNPSARRALGFATDEPIGQRNFSEFNTSATNQLFAAVIVPAVKRGEVWVGQTTVYLANRREVAVSHMVIGHRDAQGRVERYSAVMRDVSAAVEAQQEILRQSATLRSVADAIPATVAVTDTAGRYRFVNRAFEQQLGMPRERILGRGVREVLGEAEFERRRPWIERARAGEPVSFEIAYTEPAGERHLAISYIPLRVEQGQVEGMVVVAQDISSHRREASRLRQLAQHDPLTGLLNRAGFEQALDRMQQDSGGAEMAALYIDLDHFKPVNDRHGHAVGDQVLQIFGRRLLNLVRPTDAVARLGGDEFAIALGGVREIANAEVVADKVLSAAKAPFHVGPLLLQIGASLGVAHNARPQADWQGLLGRADARLLQAKAAGRGRRASDPG